MALDSRIKTMFFLSIMTLIVLVLGNLIGGWDGLLIAAGIAIIINFVTYFWSDKFVLAAYRAKPIHIKDNPGLYAIVEDVAKKADVPMPKLYVIPSTNPNAFATGRNPDHAAVAVTEGILSLLNKDELKGVIAHEMSHIKNRDILVASIAGMIAGVISYVALIMRFTAIFGRGDGEGPNFLEVIVISIITPIIALILQMAISRSREYLADSTGASIIGSGESLASALEKLEAGGRRRPMHLGNQGTAHLFIMNPFASNAFMELFSSHPSVQSRVKRLRGLT